MPARNRRTAAPAAAPVAAQPVAVATPPAQPQQLSFWKRPGEGIIYTKPARDQVIRSGQVCLPEIGSCFIDGTHGYPQFRGDDPTLVKLPLVQRHADNTRTLVAHLEMPGKQGLNRRDATITLVTPTEGKPSAWRAVVTVQHGDAGPYLRVFLPTVAELRSPGRAKANGVAVG